MRAVDIIRKKREGQSLSVEEIDWMVAGIGHHVADYQWSALLMAILWRGMTDLETAALTDAMMRSGSVVDLANTPGLKIDKHSTGGVGDKTSLILAPIAAAAGVPVPMVSGRGLGHTGGTLDKLESIPGFRVDLDLDRYRHVLQECGLVMIGQTTEIAPADKVLYALRDATATIESIPLISASIMSRREPIPAEYTEAAERARQGMLEALSLVSDKIMELLLEEQEVPLDLIHSTIREATVAQQICPVLVGSAYKNKGVQLLLDAVNAYLPSPLDREIFAKDNNDGMAEVLLTADPTEPMVAMAFKLVEEAFGQVTYMRIYQGTLSKGQFYWNSRQRKKARISRILRVHADEKEDIDEASAGDIVAVMGIECATGDTYCDEGTNYSLESIFAAEPVIDLAVSPIKRADQDKLSKALNRFMREDPTFRVHVDKETSETIISGMGELHLEIYVERIRREYKVDCTVGMPKVSYREAPTKVTSFDYKHRKQTGGSGQYAHIKGVLEPLPEESAEQFIFENDVTGGRIPSEYIPSVEKGFRDSLHKGPVAGYEVLGVKMILQDGSYHDVDSSDMAFQICARDCFRETFRRADPVLLEPIMKVEVEVPTEFLGPVQGAVSSKRGVILGTEGRGQFSVIMAEVPLSEMFGYSNDLRSMTQGKGSFSMEFFKYQKLPARYQEEVVKKAQLEKSKT